MYASAHEYEPPFEHRRKKRSYKKIAPLIAAALLVPLFSHPGSTVPAPPAPTAAPTAVPTVAPTAVPQPTATPVPSAHVTFVSFESLGLVRLVPEQPEDITAISYTMRDAAIDAELDPVAVDVAQLAGGAVEWYTDLYAFWEKFSSRYTGGATMDIWIDIHLTHADGTEETIRTRCDAQDYAFWSNYNPFASEIEMYINFSPDDPVPEIYVSEDYSQVTKTRFHVWLYGADFDPESVSIQINENYIAVRFPVENLSDEVETHLWLRLQGSAELFDYKEIVPIYREEGVY